MTWMPLWAQGLLILAGLLVARAALSTARTPQGAAAWVVFLVSFPLIALPAYALFGSVSRINARIDDRHRSRMSDGKLESRLGLLAPITRTTLHDGNELRLLINGRATFDAIFEAIDGAEQDVAVQYYMIADDALGHELRDHLIAAAKRGVKVRVLCDLVGSLFLGWRYSRELRAAGIELRGIPGPHRALGRIGLNFRNHRKAVIVDGRIGFTGGINAGQDYIDGGKAFKSWRDTHLRMEGPMAAQLHHLFAADWEAVTETKLPELPVPGHVGSVRGLVTGHGPTDKMERGSLLLCGLVGLAKRRLWIATPYLIPHADLITALQLAALRGVEVKILIPRDSDNILAWYATRNYALSQTGIGIQIHEYMPGFMHQKIILIDDDIASVGTINIDMRSSLLNFEETALIEDRGFAQEVEAMLIDDFANAQKLEPPGAWHVRLLSPVARLFGPLL
ncbi:cardiolipin synthase [Oceaniglobus trochenteri]|uniref:cardiolipin synthase n=1 Tax=Oceaniglobus trochenteri TaxID=2763260 RepID=UPI001CFFCBD3|nr:cardiolipin synthase [Oceaniglobus trochenteri]